MGLTAFFFYLFAILALAAGAMVIVAKNPVHAVLFLILTFFNAAGLFILLGAEFLAMLLVIVYVGAVAVLFLFVVMMLDVDFAELRAGFIRNAPVGLLVGGVGVFGTGLVLVTLASNLGSVPDYVPVTPLVLGIPAAMFAAYLLPFVILWRSPAEFGGAERRASGSETEG